MMNALTILKTCTSNLSLYTSFLFGKLITSGAIGSLAGSYLGAVAQRILSRLNLSNEPKIELENLRLLKENYLACLEDYNRIARWLNLKQEEALDI